MQNKNVLNDPARAGHMTGAVNDSFATEKPYFSLPMKRWYTLKEACEAKGLAYKTACNRVSLQPHGGVTEGRIGGRKCWRYETIRDWVDQADGDIEEVRND